MKTAQLFNSIYEVGLRFLIILYLSKDSPNSNTKYHLLAIDHIALYGQNYQISDLNLHSNSSYSSAEFANRYLKVDNILNYLSNNKLITSHISKNKEYVYLITEHGCKVYEKLDKAQEYFRKYYNNLLLTLNEFEYKRDTDLFNLILKNI